MQKSKPFPACQNWFVAMASMRNTVKAWAGAYGCPRAIAQHIQAICAAGATQAQAESVASASAALISQVGH